MTPESVAAKSIGIGVLITEDSQKMNMGTITSTDPSCPLDITYTVDNSELTLEKLTNGIILVYPKSTATP